MAMLISLFAIASFTSLTMASARFDAPLLRPRYISCTTRVKGGSRRERGISVSNRVLPLCTELWRDTERRFLRFLLQFSGLGRAGHGGFRGLTGSRKQIY